MRSLKGEKKISRRRFLHSSLNKSALLAASTIAPISLGSCETGNNYPFDIVIKNGTVFNGVDSNPSVVDIGVKGDKITFIGKINGKANQTLNAEGLAIMPGFIDIHTHCDLTFRRTGWKRHLAHVMPSWKGNYNYLSQGVTTVVTGNCGYGYADMDEWYGITDSVGFGTNVYHLAPHGMIREELFGADQPRELSRSQLDRFKKRLEEEMQKGAIGFSTGLEYAPGLLASTDELVELCKVVNRYNGIYATHVRNESGAIDVNTGEVMAVQSINEAIEIGKRSGIPVEISHLKIAAPINGHPASLVLNPIEKARADGLRVTADQYPYNAGSTIISILLPDQFRSSVGVKESYKTREGKNEIRKAIKEVFTYLGPDKTLVTMYPEKEEYEGKTILQISEIENRSPEDSYADMVCEDNSPMGVFFHQDINVVRDIMANDFIITGSDGWTVPKDMTRPHPRTYGSFPRKLRQFVLEEKIIDLSMAIRSMTSLPAETFNMPGRGKLQAGYFADIVAIDMDRIKDNATYLDPHKYSTGVTHLIVNGSLSIKEGEFTGERAGKSLRKS
ncbi:D-aminoacylase [bacterium]|nr:D-aminoacylase [bacterium]